MEFPVYLSPIGFGTSRYDYFVRNIYMSYPQTVITLATREADQDTSNGNYDNLTLTIQATFTGVVGYSVLGVAEEESSNLGAFATGGAGGLTLTVRIPASATDLQLQTEFDYAPPGYVGGQSTLTSITVDGTTSSTTTTTLAPPTTAAPIPGKVTNVQFSTSAEYSEYTGGPSFFDLTATWDFGNTATNNPFWLLAWYPVGSLTTSPTNYNNPVNDGQNSYTITRLDPYLSYNFTIQLMNSANTKYQINDDPAATYPTQVLTTFTRTILGGGAFLDEVNGYGADPATIVADLADPAKSNSTVVSAALLAAAYNSNVYQHLADLSGGMLTLSTADSSALMNELAKLPASRVVGRLASPINVAVPTGSTLPPPPRAGSYFVAVSSSQTPAVTYTFQGSTDTLTIGGGIQVFNQGQTTEKTLALGDRYTVAYVKDGVAVQSSVLVQYKGSTAGSVTSTGVACFLADAPVLTPAGYRRIASLRNGDLVVTSTGAVVPIQAVTARPVAASSAVNPYVIPKGRFGALRDLAISPDHKVAVGDKMIPAIALGLRQKHMTGDFMYYNLELPDHENMVVAGVTVESQYPIRRVTMTMAEFREMLVAQYGILTPAILAAVQKKVRLLADGRVIVPVDKRA
jgi:hypothetical protein